MASVATYLNLPGTIAEAFTFYKDVFGTEFAGDGIMRMGDVPAQPGAPEMPEEQKQLVMHVGLPILGGHLLMGTDEMGVTPPDAMQIVLNPDTREEADELYAKLSDGGEALQPMEDQFWGDYWGMLKDRFGVSWMVTVYAQG